MANVDPDKDDSIVIGSYVMEDSTREDIIEINITVDSWTNEPQSWIRRLNW